jgi:hypothetical protein
LAPEKLALLSVRLGSSLHFVFEVIAAISVAAFLVGLFFPKGKIAGRSRAVSLPAEVSGSE